VARFIADRRAFHRVPFGVAKSRRGLAHPPAARSLVGAPRRTEDYAEWDVQRAARRLNCKVAGYPASVPVRSTVIAISAD
jgi:hypothetical protein